MGWRSAALFGLLALGCSSGTSAQAKADMCQALSGEYAAAVLKAEECTPGAAGPCTTALAKTFYCRCKEYVAGDTSAAAMIDARFQAAGCVAGCAGSCILLSPASCQPDPTSSTGARCIRDVPDGGP